MVGMARDKLLVFFPPTLGTDCEEGSGVGRTVFFGRASADWPEGMVGLTEIGDACDEGGVKPSTAPDTVVRPEESLSGVGIWYFSFPLLLLVMANSAASISADALFSSIWANISSKPCIAASPDASSFDRPEGPAVNSMPWFHIPGLPLVHCEKSSSFCGVAIPKDPLTIGSRVSFSLPSVFSRVAGESSGGSKAASRPENMLGSQWRSVRLYRFWRDNAAWAVGEENTEGESATMICAQRHCLDTC